MRTSATSASWVVDLQAFFYGMEIFEQWPLIIRMTYVDLPGMSTAIKLKQLANEAGDEVTIDHQSQSDS